MGDNINECNIKTIADLSNNKGITITHWNCRSLFPKMDEIIYIASHSKAEILFFTETFLNDSVNDAMIGIPGYRLVRLDRDTTLGKSRGGGIIAYYQNQLKISTLPELYVSTPGTEAMVIKLDLTNVRDIYYIGVYRPPDKPVEEFINQLDNLILKIPTRRAYELNIIGDTNIDLSGSRSPQIKKYKDFLKRHGLVNIINGITHEGTVNTRATLIDHFVTNNIDLYSQHGICPTLESDHHIIYTARKKFKGKHNKIQVRVRKYKNMNETEFINQVTNHDWSNVLDNNNPTSAWDNFVSGFNQILDKYAPWRLMYFDDKLPEWMTRECLSNMRERDRLKVKAKISKLEIDKEIAHRKRNKVSTFKMHLK